MSLRLVRSPVAPNTTNTTGGATADCAGAGSSGGTAMRTGTSAVLDRVAAELGAQRGHHTVGEGVVLPRAEAPHEREGQHLGGHVPGDGLEHGPASLAGVLDPALDL